MTNKQDTPQPELEEQPLSDDSKCPECGGDPKQTVEQQLSALGYLHSDQKHVCRECGHRWFRGVPIGEFDRPEMAAELWCDSCDDSHMLVHRVVAANKRTYTLHLKCPECYNFDMCEREPDDEGRALVGHPQITGNTDGADPYGYTD